MTLLLSPDALHARRAVVRGPLAPLAASLRDDLSAVLRASADGVWLPREKAQLSRAGGVCPRDGARLGFDPFAPRAHRCPQCGAVYTDEAHYRWWIMGYQLWLAERAVHAAALHALAAPDASGASSDSLGTFAVATLDAAADAYLTYPNADNVLGPTRPFFSTYLESLWLLHLCVALDLLEAAGATSAALGARVRDRLIEPSVALIASYDEGWSNRQAWHVAARLATARLLGRDAAAEDATHGAHGLVALLDQALLADGTWYEGENYHQFAHRGLWYALTIAERAFGPLPDAPRARFARGFDAPFRVALPDLSLPSRRDSQYAVSLRQWRWAEWCELGLTHASDARGLAGTLAALYAAGQPPRDSGRWRATGESERNEPAAALTRADLGWKSLFFARPSLPNVKAEPPRTVLEDAQGFAVFRHDRGRLWVGVDYGASGGGHGHADRLNLTLADGGVRWLDDVGTGTYVERTLHWYRSTLAHQAPLADGASQARRDGTLLAFDESPDARLGWIDATVQIAPHVHARRTVVVCDEYVVDVLRWTATQDAVVDLPIHLVAKVDGIGAFAAANAGGAGGLEDGFDFLRNVAAAECAPGAIVQLQATPHLVGDVAPAERRLDGWLRADAATTWFRAVGPGAPGAAERAFYFVRQRGRDGRIVSVWDPRGAVRGVEVAGQTIRVARADGGDDEHAPEADGWRVRQVRGDRETDRVEHSVRLAARAPAVSPRRGPTRAEPEPPPEFVLPPDGSSLRWTLGRAHYVRSEAEWDEAGRPTAAVAVHVRGDTIEIDVRAHLARVPCFVAAGAINALDNERADVNSDGVQLLLVPARADAQPLAWLLVPQLDGLVRVTATSLGATPVLLDATWRPEPDGFALACTLPLAAAMPLGACTFGLDVAVNERPPGRERRRGQLVLSGAFGERVYLRGDRMDAARALVVRLPRP